MEKVLTPSQKYYLKNRDAIIEYNKARYHHNKEHILLQKKGYYKNNRDKLLQKSKDYYFTDEGKKNHRIVIWKQQGVIHDDFDALYDKYINTNECELCDIPITSGRGLIGKKHLDHDHKTGLFRNILCGNCNTNVLRKK